LNTIIESVIGNFSKKIELSVIVPVYNEEDNVKLLVDKILAVLKNINKKSEVIIIDDGSNDRTADILKEIAKEHKEVKGIIFRRNYGQTAAMSAGFDYAKGDMIITLDGDLQNDPADIPLLISKFNEGYDVVSGWRINRQDKLISRKIPSMIANKIISKFTGVNLHDYGCSLKIYKAEIAKEIMLYGEMHRFIPALAAIEGAKVAEVPVNHHPRIHGKSKYNILRTFKVILDLMTVVFWRKFITRPLHIFGRLGLASFACGFLISLYLACIKLFSGVQIGNRPLLILGVLLILTGVQLISTGIVAEIAIRTYYESQKKSIYKVREILNKD
jgi:glycosyltransferase involved in cell wall biosynthesis